MPSRSNVAMFGKDLSVDGMLMHSAEFCLPSPCYCPAAFAEQEGRQLLRWQDQPEQMLRRCSNDDSKGQQGTVIYPANFKKVSGGIEKQILVQLTTCLQGSIAAMSPGRESGDWGP